MYDACSVGQPQAGNSVCSNCRYHKYYWHYEAGYEHQCFAYATTNPITGEVTTANCKKHNAQGNCPHFEAIPPKVKKDPWLIRIFRWAIREG